MKKKKDEEFINPFIEPIVKKRKRHDFKAFIILLKAFKMMNNCYPDFVVLYRIWELCDFSNKCYMISYNEDYNLHLFLGYIKSKNNNIKVMMFKDKNYSFNFALEPQTRRINIEIYRNVNKPSEKISFIDGQYNPDNMYEKEKILFITSNLMYAVKELMIYLYKNKRF